MALMGFSALGSAGCAAILALVSNKYRQDRGVSPIHVYVLALGITDHDRPVAFAVQHNVLLCKGAWLLHKPTMQFVPMLAVTAMVKARC